jgi:hypothetical protein
MHGMQASAAHATVYYYGVIIAPAAWNERSVAAAHLLLARLGLATLFGLVDDLDLGLLQQDLLVAG